MIKRVIFHIWADGHGFYDLGAEATASDLDFFKSFLKTTENQTEDGHAIIAGAPIEVVEHPGPFAPMEKKNIGLINVRL